MQMQLGQERTGPINQTWLPSRTPICEGRGDQRVNAAWDLSETYLRPVWDVFETFASQSPLVPIQRPCTGTLIRVDVIMSSHNEIRSGLPCHAHFERRRLTVPNKWRGAGKMKQIKYLDASLEGALHFCGWWDFWLMVCVVGVCVRCKRACFGHGAN